MDEAKNCLSKFLGDVGKSDSTRQLIMGIGTGWISGYLAMRVAKTTAFAIGGGIILLQLACDREFIKINWSKLSTQVEKAVDKVESDIAGQKSYVYKMFEFVTKNTPFTSGYIGGFLIGTAT